MKRIAFYWETNPERLKTAKAEEFSARSTIFIYSHTYRHAQNMIHCKGEFHMEKLLLNHFPFNHLPSKLGDSVYLVFWLVDESFWSSSVSNASSLALLEEINSGKKKGTWKIDNFPGMEGINKFTLQDKWDEKDNTVFLIHEGLVPI